MTRAMVAVAGAAVCIVVMLGGAAFASSLGLSPTSGPPGASFVATIECASRPVDVEVIGRNPAGPQATYPERVGTETSPGVWSYDVIADPYDDVVYATCGTRFTPSVFNVINPIMYLGPIPPSYPQNFNWVRSTVEGTDCPEGSIVTVRFEGANTTLTATPRIDRQGDWSTPIPDLVRRSDLRVTAACGSATYETLVIDERTTDPTSTTTSTTVVAGPTPEQAAAPAAQPVAAPARFTG